MLKPARWASLPKRTYQLTIQAPTTARKSPKRGLLLLPPPLVSLAAIKIPPQKAIRIPHIVILLGFSLHQSQENNGTQMALVVTKVVEAAIEVKERELVQLAKCSAKQIPAATA